MNETGGRAREREGRGRGWFRFLGAYGGGRCAAEASVFSRPFGASVQRAMPMVFAFTGLPSSGEGAAGAEGEGEGGDGPDA